MRAQVTGTLHETSHFISCNFLPAAKLQKAKAQVKTLCSCCSASPEDEDDFDLRGCHSDIKLITNRQRFHSETNKVFDINYILSLKYLEMCNYGI